MAEKRQFEFFLLRYVPDAVKDEFVNIGVVMIETSRNEAGFAEVRFTRDWRRVLCLDPQADIQMLESMEQEIRRQVVEVRNCDSVMRGLNDSLSNLVQVSGAKGVLTADPAREMETMAEMYLERLKSGMVRAVTGRQKILATMSDAWERQGVAGLVKPFPVAEYTGAGDSFTFDFGYRLANEVKLFHAVSLKARVDAGVMLAARYPKIAERMLNAKQDTIRALLTAVVDDGLDDKIAEIGFALRMMRESGIIVSTVADMPAIAGAARVELRA